MNEDSSSFPTSQSLHYMLTSSQLMLWVKQNKRSNTDIMNKLEEYVDTNVHIYRNLYFDQHHVQINDSVSEK